MSNTIKFELTHHLGGIPRRATEHSVGYDFVTPTKIMLEPNERTIVDTGVKCKFPGTMWLGIYGRSSFAKKGLVNPLGVGVVDSDYYNTGNSIGVALWNVSDDYIIIEAGEAIAQGVFHHVITAGDTVDTQRTGGFGSTDKQEPITITFNGKEYEAKRATFTMNGAKLEGVVIEYVSDKFINTNSTNYDYTFISDRPNNMLHNGDDHTYCLRCYWVSKDNENLTIL